MTDRQARALILGSFVLLVLVVELRHVVEGEGLTMRPVVGGFAGAALLAAVSEYAASFAASVALLVLVATIINSPPSMWNALAGVLGQGMPGKNALNRAQGRT